MIGETIGNLKILFELGRGGMGIVYLAEHTRLGKRFAVKHLLPALTQDARFAERFRQEARHQALLTHPNIVQVTDFIEQAGQYFLVMEYVDGLPLDELIKRRGPLPERETLSILRGVLEGLDFAHRKGITHRDIKPGNILLDAEGRARITDFGIAILAGETRLTATGGQIGTPWYMSPEQIAKPKTLDHRSDLYSVGIVLYEMLTGDVPFDGETDYAVQQQHLNAPVPDPRSRNPNLSKGVADVVLRAMEKRPGQRFSGCRAFLEAIEPQQRRPLGRGAGPESAPSAKGQRIRQAIGYLGGLAVVLGLVLWFVVRILNSQVGWEEISSFLGDQGFAPNLGLSRNYGPGNILQTQERGSEGSTRRLPSPIVFLWRNDCFPDQEPRVSPYALPGKSGRSTSLRLGGEALDTVLPGVKLDAGVVAEYSLELENIRHHALAKGDLSRHLAPDCVRALARALEDGDQIGWFAVVLESVEADSAQLRMGWKADASLESRERQKADIERKLATLGVTASLVAEDGQTTAVKVEGPIVLGYRIRSLQPVYAE